MTGRTTTGVTIPRVSNGQSSTRVTTGQSVARGSTASPVLRVVTSNDTPRVFSAVSEPRTISSTNTFGTQGVPGTGGGSFDFDSMLEEVRFLLNTNTRNDQFMRDAGNDDRITEFMIRLARDNGQVRALFDYNTDGTLNHIEYEDATGTEIQDIVGTGMSVFNNFFYTSGEYESDTWTIGATTNLGSITFEAGEFTITGFENVFEVGEFTLPDGYTFEVGEFSGLDN